VNIPTLETERLLLRGHEVKDFPAYAAMWSDPVVTRYFPSPLSEEESWKKFLRAFGQWAINGYGSLSVIDRTSGEFLGETGFFEARRNIIPSLIGIPEAGWSFAAAAHGKGYASEAVAATHRWGDAHFGRARTTAIIVPENLASIRVAVKAGYREAVQTIYHNEPITVFYRDP
jgi:RimJ/RimL family protein N-acetyltransferase